jgi:DNA polymerase-3 subunit delta'
VSGFESITDQIRPALILNSFIRKGAIPHALLFTGTEGVGKEAAAQAFAMACNCLGRTPYASSVNTPKPDLTGKPESGGPCGICGSCRKILSNSHPDIIKIKPAGPYIKISQVRELCEILAFKPYEARIRTVIISDAQTMNKAAGNALLKLLEEPPERTILILTATEKSDIIPTIASRCQQIRFNPLSEKRLAEMLIESKGIEPSEAAIFAAMANGSFTRALALSDRSRIKKRDWLVNEIETLSLKETGKCMAFAERLSREKDEFLDSLEILNIWYRDIAISKYNPGKSIFSDISDKTKAASPGHTEKDLLSKFDVIRGARKNILANANLRLTAETLVFRLAQGNSTGG